MDRRKFYNNLHFMAERKIERRESKELSIDCPTIIPVLKACLNFDIHQLRQTSQREREVRDGQINKVGKLSIRRFSSSSSFLLLWFLVIAMKVVNWLTCFYCSPSTTCSSILGYVAAAFDLFSNWIAQFVEQTLCSLDSVIVSLSISPSSSLCRRNFSTPCPQPFVP